MFKVLGIETACDDTAAAVVADGITVCSNVIASQHAIHEQHGGIVPELAARQHTRDILPTIRQALLQADTDLGGIDAIAVNNQRGLLRSLVVGIAAAKGIAIATGKPIYPVHHIEGHIYSPLMCCDKPQFPHLCLTVAGGHNYLVLVNSIGRYQLMAQTRDDAAGETLDKVAVMLGLDFPGGPAIERLASDGDPARYSLPRPMLGSDVAAFSFSGLKTAARRLISAIPTSEMETAKADVAASVQMAVVDCLCWQTVRMARRTGVRLVTLAGGVAANRCLRNSLAQALEDIGISLAVADKKLCTDNAAMIAGLAYRYHESGCASTLDFDAYPDEPLRSWAD